MILGTVRTGSDMSVAVFSNGTTLATVNVRHDGVTEINITQGKFYVFDIRTISVLSETPDRCSMSSANTTIVFSAGTTLQLWQYNTQCGNWNCHWSRYQLWARKAAENETENMAVINLNPHVSHYSMTTNNQRNKNRATDHKFKLIEGA